MKKQSIAGLSSRKAVRPTLPSAQNWATWKQAQNKLQLNATNPLYFELPFQ